MSWQLLIMALGGVLLLAATAVLKPPRSLAWLRIVMGLVGLGTVGWVGYVLVAGDASEPLSVGLMLVPWFVLLGGWLRSSQASQGGERTTPS